MVILAGLHAPEEYRVEGQFQSHAFLGNRKVDSPGAMNAMEEAIKTRKRTKTARIIFWNGNCKMVANQHIIKNNKQQKRGYFFNQQLGGLQFPLLFWGRKKNSVAKTASGRNWTGI